MCQSLWMKPKKMEKSFPDASSPNPLMPHGGCSLPSCSPGLKKNQPTFWGRSLGVTHHPAKSLAFQASMTSAMVFTVRPSGSFRSSLASPLKLPQGAQRRLTKAALAVKVTSPLGLKSTSNPDVWEMVMFPDAVLKEMASDTSAGRRVKRPFTCRGEKCQKWVKNAQQPRKVPQHKSMILMLKASWAMRPYIELKQ